jgi:hypothetical protein
MEESNISVLFSDDNLREFFMSSLSFKFESLGFVGLLRESDSLIILYRKGEGSFYEPFHINEFVVGSSERRLFEMLHSVFNHFDVRHPICIGFDGFCNESLKNSALDYH